VRGVPQPSDAVYRRRRVGAALLLTVVLLAVAGVVVALRGPGAAPVSVRTGSASGALVDQPAAYGAGHTSPPPGSFYVVQPGDTLWKIASELVPADHVRDEVDRLADLNGSAALQAGQRLQLAPSPDR
jgi:Tfp pilus assembly protein FimV